MYIPGLQRRWWVLLGLLGLLVSAVRANPIVERVSFAPRADGSGYVVRLHINERVHAYSEPRLVDGNQLELVLFHATLARHCQRDEPSGPIQAYSFAERQGHLYLRLQLENGIAVRANAYRDRDSEDILIALAYRNDALLAWSGSDRTPSPAATTPEPSVMRPVGERAPLNDARRRWKLDTIVIDAGHGGHDAGAVGVGGLREKDVVLAVALKLGHYLEELLGVNVVYTRENDRFVTLRDRGRLANEAGAKLFISIHANAASNRSDRGSETYFLGLHKSEAARKVMERENSVIKLESNPEAYASLNEQALIEMTLAQSAYMRKSEELAALIQHQFARRVGRPNRGVKQAGFYVLWSASMPAVLVELGFVTNREEAAFLASEKGQDYLASAIFRAMRDFKVQYEKGLDLVVSQ